jgi:hypothetical protein
VARAIHPSNTFDRGEEIKFCSSIRATWSGDPHQTNQKVKTLKWRQKSPRIDSCQFLSFWFSV